MKVVTAGSIPPEVSAYTLARYSRSADDFKTSLDWVRKHDSGKFLETFYFQYGHPSIADLGHVTMSMEGISEIAAVELLDEQEWSGQQKSTRYQDFSQVEPVIPPGLDDAQTLLYCNTFEKLRATYIYVNAKVRDYLMKETPRPSEMKLGDYGRAINAKAFDVARYLLPMGIPTNVGQITSIRTLEKQIRRLLSSPYTECVHLAEKMRDACSRSPDVKWHDCEYDEVGPMAPTLAKYLVPNDFLQKRAQDVFSWYVEATRYRWGLKEVNEDSNNVRLYRAGQEIWSTKNLSSSLDVLSTLLYPICQASLETILSFGCSLSGHQYQSAFDAAVSHRGPYDELPREFRNQPYIFEITLDLGAYRDLHRHRRCQQFRQPYTIQHGYETPELIGIAGVAEEYDAAQRLAKETYMNLLPLPAANYILPLATRVRALFKMDFAEVDYICRLRTKVGGHPSYRKIAWQMAELIKKEEPYLGRLIEATNPEVEEPLCR